MNKIKIVDILYRFAVRSWSICISNVNRKCVLDSLNRKVNVASVLFKACVKCIVKIEGKKHLSYKLPARPDDIFYYNEDISIFGNYIYFSNDNGIYRCSTKNKKGFELYYDAKEDANFGQCRVFGICAAGKDKFYVMFIEKDNIELNMPTKLVEYKTSASEATDNLN